MSVEVTVTGAEKSGKTSLINSMLYGCVLAECSPATKNTPKFGSQDITGTLVESPLVETPLGTTPLSLISPSSMDNSALVILCMQFNATEANMIRILCSFFKEEHKNVLVVLTYANVNVSGESFNEVVERQTEVIKRILRDKTCMNEQFVDSLKVIPAGYHTQVIIKDDPSKKHWIMNLWLQAIASAKPTAQAALIVLVNYYIYGKISLPKNLAHCKRMYVQDLTAILEEIIQTQKLDLGSDFEV